MSLPPDTGQLKFAILHHAACSGRRFHYCIHSSGERDVLLAESEPGEHAQCIGIMMAGDGDAAPPSPEQMAALRELLRELKARYPDLQVGGHRQIRGSTTTCPGQHFPLNELRHWSTGELIAERDAAMQDIVDRQYRP